MRLLLVEDNLTDALLVEDALDDMQGLSPQLTHVERLSAAEEQLENAEFDVVLIDLNLPDGQGLENFERLQMCAPDTPMIVLTGLANEEVALQAIQRGAADYLIKGDAPSALLERSIKYSVERKKNENSRLELVKAQVERAEAEAANRAKDEFLATISHELRTPLNAIMGWATLLKEDQLDRETVQQALIIIERNARIQAQLIEDLLDVSRIITGNFRLEYADVDLNTVVKAATDALVIQANTKEVALDLELKPVATLCGDPTRLQQVAWNLISNAIKFTPKGGSVTVTTESDEETVTLCVVDTGAGIAPEFLPYVFERFRQADGSTTRRHGGLGLGLAIVQHIVELHGGSITAQSEGKNQGATFCVSLPWGSMPAVEI